MSASKSKALAKPLQEQSIDELIPLAHSGNREACEMVYNRMEAAGHADAYVEKLTNNAVRIRQLRFSDSPIVEEAYRRKMEQMRKDLGMETAAPLEKLLIDRIVICWFHLNDMEINVVSSMKNSVSLAKAEYLQKSLDRAESRYQAAIKSLAIARRLQIPSVQVNIGEKQINVIQGQSQDSPALAVAS